MNEPVPDRPWARTLGAIVAAMLVALAAALLHSRLAATEVLVVTPEPSEVVRTLVVSGQVRPPARSELGVSVAGVVREIRAREGDTVAAGEILARLDDREAVALLAQAEARLLDAEAVVRDELVRAELELDEARRNAERLRSVFAEGALTLQTVEEANRRVSDAESRLAALRGGSGEVGMTARVAEAQAAVEAARARRAAHVVRAPFDGVVLARLAEPGSVAQVGRGLLDLAATGRTELVAFPSEDNLGGLTVGTEARGSADAYPDESFRATVTLVAPSVDADQGTVEVRLALDEPVSYLRPGMTVSLNLQLERRSADLVLPVGALRGLATGDPWVAVVTGGRVQRRPVSLGAVGDTLVEVVSGLEAGEQVVATADAVEPGERVRTTSER